MLTRSICRNRKKRERECYWGPSRFLLAGYLLLRFILISVTRYLFNNPKQGLRKCESSRHKVSVNLTITSHGRRCFYWLCSPWPPGRFWRRDGGIGSLLCCLKTSFFSAVFGSLGLQLPDSTFPIHI